MRWPGDVSPSLRNLAARADRPHVSSGSIRGNGEVRPVRPERNIPGSEDAANQRFATDLALQAGEPSIDAVSAPIANFEGLSNQDNFNVFGFRVNPPDPVGDVGPNHYVEMINLVFGVYSKTGTLLLGPGGHRHPVDRLPGRDCTDPSGDPIVVYDQFVDRWILTQFTTSGLGRSNGLPFYNCVAISTTGDPTGSYYRYAFITTCRIRGGYFFPDYPKYGVWTDSYVITTRDFGLVDDYGISVYASRRTR